MVSFTALRISDCLFFMPLIRPLTIFSPLVVILLLYFLIESTMSSNTSLIFLMVDALFFSKPLARLFIVSLPDTFIVLIKRFKASIPGIIVVVLTLPKVSANSTNFGANLTSSSANVDNVLSPTNQDTTDLP